MTKKINRIDPERKFVILSLESDRWVVVGIWHDVRVFRACDEFRDYVKARGEKAKFEVAFEDEYFSGKPFSFLKPPDNVAKLLGVFDVKKDSSPQPVEVVQVPVKTVSFEDWLKEA